MKKAKMQREPDMCPCGWFSDDYKFNKLDHHRNCPGFRGFGLKEKDVPLILGALHMLRARTPSPFRGRKKQAAIYRLMGAINSRLEDKSR